MTRKSVGVPVGMHTRDELIALEEEQNNATGMLKGYYNFMQRLTGKRSIKSYEVDNKQQQSVQTAANISADMKADVNNINFSSNNVLNRMIKGK